MATMRSSSIRSACIAASFTLCAAVACGDDDDGDPKTGGEAGESAAGAATGGGGAGALAGQGGAAGGNAGGAPSHLEELTIRFRATVGDAEFACGEVYNHQGTTDTTVVPQDLRFFVEKVRLIDADDNEVPLVMDDRPPFQTNDVALLDFEDGTAACTNGNVELNRTITGKAPPGNYVGVVFSMAVPEDLNHSDPTTLPAPLQAGGMTWGWLFGFRFLKAELAVPQHQGEEGGAGGGGGQGHAGAGHATAEGGSGHGGGHPAGSEGSGHGHPESPGGVFHLGSIECTNSAEPDHNAPPATACAKQFRNEIRLDNFNPEDNVVVADVGKLFSGVDLSSDSQCHSFAGSVCPALFEAVGLDYASGDNIDGQTFFRVQ